MVTKTNFPKLDWAKKHKNSSINYQNIDTNPIAVIGAVSREYGLDAVMTFPKSINKARFLVFLQKIRDRFPFEDIVLVMDNLGLHKSLETRERMDELGFRYCYLPRYSPWTNGTEEVWNISK